MKYLKTFENNGSEDAYSEEDFKVGDEIYCIDNGSYKSLNLGEKYIIHEIKATAFKRKLIYIESLLCFGGFFGYRFTKDPNHPAVIKYTAKKYNI